MHTAGGTVHLTPDSTEEARFRLTVISFVIVAAAIVVTAITLTMLSITTDVAGTRPTSSRPASSGATSSGSSNAAAGTTTTVSLVPPAAQPSPTAAASALVSSWAAGDRNRALSVATPRAVTTLFAVPYAAGHAIARGCSTAFPPLVCTYGPPGGASPTDAIYQLRVAQAPAGWYVTSVVIDN